MKISKSSGFTLIEVMIVVAVIGVLAAIALPSYSEYVNRGKRAEARAEVLKGEGWLERFYSENNRYANNATNDDNTAFTARFSSVPSSGTANYNVTLAVTASTYTITATPVNSMAGDMCGAYVKTNTGSLDVPSASAGDAPKCLRR